MPIASARSRAGAVSRRCVSSARGEAGPGSDLDLLVAFGPGRGFRDLMNFCEEVESALGRRVDVVVEDGLSPHIRDRVLEEAVAL